MKDVFDYKHLGFGFLIVVAVAVVSSAAVAVGAFLEPRQFAFSYLWAYAFFFTIAVGSLFWIILHHAVDADWSVVAGRQLENVAWLMPVLALLFIPLALVAPDLWSWMRAPEKLGAGGRDAFLNEPFFWGRAVVYFAFFLLAAGLLRAFSVAQDATGDIRYTVANRRVAFASLIPFAGCMTFFAIDWLMSLSAHWYSAMWGVYIFAGSILAALCMLVVILAALRRLGYLAGVVTLEHFHILGKLMLAFTIFWAYIGFSQYMLIWYARIPEETAFFDLRTQGSWLVLSAILVIGHFFVPFLLLLPRFGKRRPGFLAGVALWLLAMHLLDLFLIVRPVLDPQGVRVSLLDFGCVVALGSILATVFLARLGQGPLYPVRDPRLPESISLEN